MDQPVSLIMYLVILDLIAYSVWCRHSIPLQSATQFRRKSPPL